MDAERLPRDSRMTAAGKPLQIERLQSADISAHDGAEPKRPTMRKAPCATRAELQDILAKASTDVVTAGYCLGLSRSASYRAAQNGSLPTIRVSGRLVVACSTLARMLGAELEP